MSMIIVLLATSLIVDPALAAKKPPPVPPTSLHVVCRDAKTGRYVQRAYAEHYPDTTVCEIKRF
jgi:hypothetical protein